MDPRGSKDAIALELPWRLDVSAGHGGWEAFPASRISCKVATSNLCNIGLTRQLLPLIGSPELIAWRRLLLRCSISTKRLVVADLICELDGRTRSAALQKRRA